MIAVVADIRIKTSFLNHRKRRKLKLLLGVDATGCVLDLWLNAAMLNPDGILRGMDHEDIALDAGWDGQGGMDARQFCAALLEVKFLDQLPDGTYVLHDWTEHQAWVVTSPARVARARKANDVRWRKGPKAAGADGQGPDQAPLKPQKMPEVGQKSGPQLPEASGEDATRMQQGCGEDAARMQQGIPLSSSSSSKGIKTPPERATALSTPKGVEGDGVGKVPSAKFSKPSLLEVAAYCVERANGINAQAFIDHYTANGWKVGRNPMKCWRATVRTWEAKRTLEQHPDVKNQTPAARLLAKSQGGAGS